MALAPSARPEPGAGPAEPLPVTGAATVQVGARRWLARQRGWAWLDRPVKPLALRAALSAGDPWHR